MQPYEYILQLMNLKNINERKALLRQAAVDGCYKLFEGFKLTFEKQHIFNVKKAPLIEIENGMDLITSDFTWKDFLNLINTLETTNKTDKEISNLLNDAASVSGILEWNIFYRCILLKKFKDLKITPKMINEVLNEFGNDAKKYCIHIWSVHKATDGMLLPNVDYAVEPLIDGQRVITILNCHNNTVKMYNDNGKYINHFTQITKLLEPLLQELPVSMVLDGNVIKKTYNQILSTQTSNESNYAIYDILSLEDFIDRQCPIPYIERREVLSGLQQTLLDMTKGRAFILPSMIINKDDIDTKHKKYIELLSTFGYTNVINKHTNSNYICDRNSYWIKQEIK